MVADEVARKIAGRHVLLLTDYDGTLAELAPTPEQAVLSDSVCQEMERLAALPSLTFGVVSGRRLVDVGQRAGAAAEFVAGLHGLEITGPDCAFHHYALDSVSTAIDRVYRDARRTLSWCPGLYLENKTYALTCHVRLSPPAVGDRALEEFEALAEPQLEAGVLKQLHGARALELLPAADWHKGRAVAWIRARVEARLGRRVPVVYLGDDRTDEDAFDVLDRDDVAIGVGERPHTHLIDWRLAGPGSVGRFFGHLATLRGTAISLAPGADSSGM